MYVLFFENKRLRGLGFYGSLAKLWQDAPSQVYDIQAYVEVSTTDQVYTTTRSLRPGYEIRSVEE